MLVVVFALACFTILFAATLTSPAPKAAGGAAAAPSAGKAASKSATPAKAATATDSESDAPGASTRRVRFARAPRRQLAHRRISHRSLPLSLDPAASRRSARKRVAVEKLTY